MLGQETDLESGKRAMDALEDDSSPWPAKKAKSDVPSTGMKTPKSMGELAAPVAEQSPKVTEKQLTREEREAERKLEKARKEAERKAEKLRKDALKAAEKARKEAEKLRAKEQRELEKQLEKERKEAEKERKEAEKQLEKERKEAEKLAEKEKKEAEKKAAKEQKEKERLKAQPRINLFFKANPVSSNSSFSAASQKEGHPPPSASPASNDDKNSNENLTDYQKHILPFHVKQHAQLFSKTCNYIYEQIETTEDPLEWLQKVSSKTVKARQPSKLTSHEFKVRLALAHESSEVANLLTRIRMRRLQFSHLSPKYAEDPSAPINEEYRPPYIGSTRDISEAEQHQLALDPFRTDVLANIAYEYDSEVEWDEADGEDLRDDDGDDSDDDIEDPEDLKEFLSSDEDDSSTSKGPKLVGPLTPVLIWANTEDSSDLLPFSVELLHDTVDPLAQEKSSYAEGAAEGETSASQSNEDSFSAVIKTLEKKVGYDILKSSLAEHNGSTGTKTLIVELLKQKFTTATGQEIRGLFDRCMTRVGKKRTEKKWVLNPEASVYFSVESSQHNYPGES